MANTDTGLVVYEKNSETPMAAASLTKLMTMILMLESYQDQLDTISITAPGYIYDYLYGKNASTADIWKDETHTLRSLLYAMLLPSANEAAYIVADYMSGSSIDNFVAMMNDEAARIGCTGTTFTDPCGLDPGNGMPTCWCGWRWAMMPLPRRQGRKATRCRPPPSMIRPIPS